MTSKIEAALDVIAKLEATNQTYIVGHDVPISVSRHVYALLESKRREVAKLKGIPEEQLEFEDLLGMYLGLPPP